jgi:hypothetical protein
VVQLSLAPARNEKLFSRNYLEDRLPDSQEWERTEDEARRAWEELKEIYSEEKSDLSERRNDEEGLRHKFISPILERVLDYSIEKEKTAFGQSSPDYALYENDEARSGALRSEDEYGNAVGLLEAKAWKKKLEMKKKGGGQLYDRLNPTVQVMEYLYNSEPRWAILTNGKRWRLYNQEASSKMDTYYEVDLITILENDDFRQFKYFYLLFRKEALTGGEGDAFVDQVREESNRYARDVGEDLEDNLYQALLWLTKGISKVNNNDVDPEEELDELQNESLIFLYRLVFLFYVDSREIMPDPADQGEELYSFPSLVDEVLDDIDNGEVSEIQTRYFNKLQEIFKMVKKGSEAQGIDREKLFVPAYNGNLFSSEEHRFLVENTIRDEYIAKVIKLLAKDDDGRRIDYSDLSVRHLGGIYEGLLEYELNYASETRILKDGKYEKLSDLDKHRDEFEEENIVEQELYLATDDEERKATGSYYTPDYIVEYIVENTVGPKLEERIEEAEREADNKDERDQLVQKKILDLNILDPAMGSGHFLVEVIDHIASEILEYTEKDIQGVKRDVARRCIYGVDINNMATELAKVSIWLNTISSEKPLSFLDHRIKTGNSLIGADIHDINRHPEEDEDSERQVTIGEEFGEENAGVVRANVQKMLEKFKEIQEKEEESPEDIKEQEEIYQEFLDFPFRKRFDVLADVYTSHYFDNNYKVDDYNRLLQAFKLSEQKEEGDEEWNKVIKEDWVQKATNSLDNSHKEDNISSQKGFFHWKLEFPEVFFDIEEGTEKQDSGFDAVVGNPPYARNTNLPEDQKKFYKKFYKTSHKQYDIYVLFLEKARDYLNKNSDLGFIISNKFMASGYGKRIREFMLENYSINEITDVSTLGVFGDASVYPCIFSFSNRESDSNHKIDIAYRVESQEKLTNRNYKTKKLVQSEFEETDQKRFLINLTTEEMDIVQKLEEETRLGDISEIIRGTPNTELNEIEDSPLNVREQISDEEFKYKSLESTDILRYAHSYSGDAIIHDDSEAGKSRRLVYDEPKILMPRTVLDIKASYDDEGFYIRDRIYVISLDNKKLAKQTTGVLNSSLIQFNYDAKFESTHVSGGYYDLRGSQLKELPIKTQNRDDLDRKVETMRSLYKELNKINLNIRDYLTTSLDDPDGKTLGEMYMPVEGLSDSILTDTKEERNNIKIGSVEFEEQNNSLILNVSVKYKPENDEEFDDEELDRWGYVETDLMPAMNFTVGDKIKALVKEFVPVAVDEAGGFANFREKATKTNSVVDRLEDLTLPRLDDVEQGLEKFIENKEEAEELEREIQETDEQIDAIVFDLYDLTEEEVETVLDSLDTPEDEKASIMEKFEQLGSRGPISSPQV